VRVLIAGGGTGGHVYPAVAIAEEIRKQVPTASIAYVGTRHGLEARVLPSLPWIRFFAIHARGFPRSVGWETVRFVWSLVTSCVQMLAVFIRFRPSVVIGVGGYGSFVPVLIGAFLARFFPIRTLIHEQNAVSGLANRALAPYVDEVLLSFPQAAASLPKVRRIAVTGNPVREEFDRMHRVPATYRSFGLDPSLRTVLVFGGSLGSSALVRSVLQAKQALAVDGSLQVLMAVGERVDERAIQEELALAGVRNVVITRYIDRMADAFAISDLIVCRAGATTLAEIALCGKPAILVPWRGAVDDHQRANAEALAAAGACEIAEDDDMLSCGLVSRIRGLVHDDEQLARMAGNVIRFAPRDARTRILGEIRWTMKEVRA